MLLRLNLSFFFGGFLGGGGSHDGARCSDGRRKEVEVGSVCLGGADGIDDGVIDDGPADSGQEIPTD